MEIIGKTKSEVEGLGTDGKMWKRSGHLVRLSVKRICYVVIPKATCMLHLNEIFTFHYSSQMPNLTIAHNQYTAF